MQKNYEQELNENIVEEAPKKREKRVRAKSYAQYNEDGTRTIDPVSGAGIWGPEPCPNKPAKAAKAPKAPKVIEYQKDEDGNDILDEEGNPIPVKKVRGPVIRRVPSHELSVITVDDAQEVKRQSYKGARAQFAVMLKDGQTVLDYLEAGGDKGFLRFYVRDGACSITPYSVHE